MSKLNQNDIYEAVVTGSLDFGIFIYIQEIGAGLITKNSLRNATRRLGSQILDTINKGTKVRVKLHDIDYNKRRATFDLVEIKS